MDFKAKPFFRLNDGSQMPSVGLGTFKMQKEEDILCAVDEALASGYRLFGMYYSVKKITAAVYGNERHLQKAFQTFLPKYDLQREDIFLISKLSPNEMYSKKVVKDGYEHIIKSLGTEYLDLFLINFPGLPNVVPSHPKHKKYRNTAWSTLVELYDDGLVNGIGVCNFTVNHLQDLIKEHHFNPTINQVEWHPYFHDNALLQFCHRNDVVLQGYSPFGGLKNNRTALQDEAVKSIAEDLCVTPAQVLLVWCLQNDVATISESTDPVRIRTNMQLDFQLNDEQMRILNKLDKGKKLAWDPYPFV